RRYAQQVQSCRQQQCENWRRLEEHARQLAIQDWKQRS
ncbi:MAG: hypothetical protein RL410_1338, partial [Actinomycetota bacterium]